MFRPSPMTCAGTRSAMACILPPTMEAAVVAAGHEGLDDDVAAARLALGGLEAPADVLLALQVEADAAAVVAVEGLTTTG